MTLSEITKQLLNENNIHINKRLGQNFLIDHGVLDRIVDAANVKKSDKILEIGTGLGVLTKELALSSKKVITLDVDNQLLQVTKSYLNAFKNIEYVNESILKYKLPKSINKVVANLPYYITSPVIQKLLDLKGIDLIVLTIQREVAERIVAGPGSKTFGSFSVYVQAHAEASINSFVPKSAFIPQPDVGSAILVLKSFKKSPYKINFDLVRAGFGKRRKTLRNSLSEYEVDFDAAGIDPGRRAETLSLEEWERLSSH